MVRVAGGDLKGEWYTAVASFEIRWLSDEESAAPTGSGVASGDLLVTVSKRLE